MAAGRPKEERELLEVFGAVFVNLNPVAFKQIITKHIDVSKFKCYFFKKSSREEENSVLWYSKIVVLVSGSNIQVVQLASYLAS